LSPCCVPSSSHFGEWPGYGPVAIDRMSASIGVSRTSMVRRRRPLRTTVKMAAHRSAARAGTLSINKRFAERGRVLGVGLTSSRGLYSVALAGSARTTARWRGSINAEIPLFLHLVQHCFQIKCDTWLHLLEPKAMSGVFAARKVMASLGA